eukprot:m.56328 g.56328  ORF g.56328 m.56328 type:complete len:119 (-) comp11187_c0_seq2:4-360(-)
MYAYRSMTITHTTQQTHTNENILIFFNTFIDNAHLLKRNVNVSELVNSEVTVVDVPINENIVIFWENSLRDLIGVLHLLKLSKNCCIIYFEHNIICTWSSTLDYIHITFCSSFSIVFI